MNTRIEIDNDDMIAVWKFMGEHFGASFTSQYGNQVKTWMKHFKRKKFTPAHLELGMEKCRELSETHAPNLSTFSRYCTPQMHDFHLPDEEEAFLMATRKDWRVPIVWFAVNKVGQWEFRTWPEGKSRKAFIKQYQKLFRLYVAGERFVIPVRDVPQLSEPEPSKEEIEDARIFLRAFGSRKDGFQPKNGINDQV